MNKEIIKEMYTLQIFPNTNLFSKSTLPMKHKKIKYVLCSSSPLFEIKWTCYNLWYLWIRKD